MTNLADKLKEQVSQPALPTAPHVIVQALAGTGKTTTLVEGLRRLINGSVNIDPSPQQQAVWDAIQQSKGAKSICFVAFNKAIATELQSRVPTGCDAMTMHSMGFKAVQKSFGRVRVTDYRVQDIIAELLGRDLKDIRKDDFELVRATENLVRLCKMNLVGEDSAEPADSPEFWAQALDEIAAHYDVDLNGSRSRVFELVPRVLERCKEVDRDRCIDFSDMIWLPIVLKLPIYKYELLLVDESQDLNRCQQALARKAGTRLVMCGDVNQAIYGFAGADSESMYRMQQELEATDAGCLVLPLTVTRRCGKAIVEEAKKIVPAFEAHESNSEGTISRAAYKGTPPPVRSLVNEADGRVVGSIQTGPNSPNYADRVQDGDMLLCRCNAPLVSQCFRFLRAGRKAEIQGRDVGQGLISTIKKMKADTLPDLIEALSNWLHLETEKENRKRAPNENRLIAMQDRYDCIICFTEGAKTVEDVISKINAVFTDEHSGKGIKLSSIHKAKGLEANRVFLLEPKGATVPHPMAKSAWQRGQEMNLRYVAITRAIEELVYVTE